MAPSANPSWLTAAVATPSAAADSAATTPKLPRTAIDATIIAFARVILILVLGRQSVSHPIRSSTRMSISS